MHNNITLIVMPAWMSPSRPPFFRHPASVCLTYYEHALFSLHMSLDLFRASVASLVHAIWPDVLETYASDTISELQARMRKIGCRKETTHSA